MRRHLIFASVITLLILTSLCLAQSDQRKQLRPNIVFILIDDLRWDELGIAGHPFIKTPHIDRIGKEGALFRNAFMTTPQTIYAGKPIPHRPNYGRTPEGKPALQRQIADLPPLGAATATRDNWNWRASLCRVRCRGVRSCRCLQANDLPGAIRS